MRHWRTLLLFFSVTTNCLHGQNVTTIINTDDTASFAISRDLLSNANFGLPNAPSTVTTTSPLKGPVTTEKTCPPEERWNAPRSASFMDCLCQKEGTDQQPCVLRLSSILGMYERMVVPAILPRISATDLGFLYIWTSLGFQCHPFMGIGGLSIACYHEIGSFPMSRDCRLSRSQYFCELLSCVDYILGNRRSQPQDFLSCVRRIAVPMTTQPNMWPPTYPPELLHPTPGWTPPVTTALPTGLMESLHHDMEEENAHDDHAMHDELDSQHMKMDTIKVVSGVVGGILGGIFITAVVFIVCWVYKRKRQPANTNQPRPKMSVRKQESDVYAEVGDTGLDSGLVNSAYLSNHAPDVISVVGSKGKADEPDYSTLNNYNGSVSSFGSPRGYLGRPPSVESNQYCTINDNDTLSKRSSRSSIYNKLREDGKTVVCDHVYNRAQFVISEDVSGNDGYDQVCPKQNNCENPQKTIMKKQPSTGSIKKRVYFTLEPAEFLQRESDDF